MTPLPDTVEIKIEKPLMSVNSDPILRNALNSIETQLALPTFTIDASIATLARNQFNHHATINRYWSIAASLAGVIGLVVCAVSIYLAFVSLPFISLIGISILLVGFWISKRNHRELLLQNAANATTEESAITILSQGVEIDERVKSGKFPYARSIPLMRYFMGKKQYRVAAYLAMIAPTPEKMRAWAMDNICLVRNVKEIQLLRDFGAQPSQVNSHDLLYLCCGENNLELLSAFVEAGAKLDAGIQDYVQWQQGLDELTYPDGRYYGKGPPNSPLSSGFETPLEILLQHNVCLGEISTQPHAILRAMRVDPSIYDVNSREDLYHSLNKAGVRIRRQIAYKLFDALRMFKSFALN